jgi:hypothetical protein
VIILAYLRSGSTFTADVIQQHPDIYYLYEPFYSTIGQQYYTNNGANLFADGLLLASEKFDANICVS